MFTLNFFWLFLFSASWYTINANTEINNFEGTEEHEIAIAQTLKWLTLRPNNNEVELSLELSSKENTIAEDCLPSGDIATWNSKSCPHQMWTVLDLNADEWRRYSKFTLRLSWPASSPANFFVQIHSPESLLTLIPHNSTSKPVYAETTAGRRTRRKYAHIRVVDETDTLPTFTQLASPNRVTFHIILEPLIMGVLPASMQLTALVLVTIVSVAVLAVPWINNYLEQMAQKARREAGQAGAEGMKDE